MADKKDKSKIADNNKNKAKKAADKKSALSQALKNNMRRRKNVTDNNENKD